MKRSELLRLIPSLGWLSVADPIVAATERPRKVIVIGAGVSGLAAAQELQAHGHEVSVLEGRDRIGGRLWTSTRWPDVPLDLGASWIHGITGNPLSQIATQIQARTVATSYQRSVLYDVDGESLSKDTEEQLEALREAFEEAMDEADEAEDRSIRLVADEVLQSVGSSPKKERLMNFILSGQLEQEYSGSAHDLSAQWHDEAGGFKGGDVVFAAGYQVIAQHLARGLCIELGQKVREIDHSDQQVLVRTQKGAFTADRVLITLPLGVLKSGEIAFTPALPTAKQKAIQALGFGVLNKCYLRFKEVFWDENADWIEYIPERHCEWTEWVSFARALGKPVLLGFNAADQGRHIESMSDAQIIASAMKTLRTLYGDDVPEPVDAQITRWASDPFAFGSYSFNKTDYRPGMRQELGRAIEGRLFFAGEATHPNYFGTVHGAFLSGQRAAKEMLL